MRELEQELFTQQKLAHPHVLPIHDFKLKSRGDRFIVTPFCEGGDLRELLRGRSFLPVDEAVLILSQIAQAVDFAHSQGFIHGDIKPENILFTHGQALLADFGISRHIEIETKLSTQRCLPAGSSNVGGSGGRGGTTAYLSPEQIDADRQYPASDTYAFATVAYELVTGHLPFDTNLPLFHQLAAKVRGSLIAPRRANPILSEAVSRALLSGLHKDHTLRPSSASMLCQMMRCEANDEDVSPTSRHSFTVGPRTQIFVSYCHRDKRWLRLLNPHLEPLQKNGTVKAWDDTKIVPGTPWRQELESVLKSADVAILLVSANFLASEFVVTKEIPILLACAGTSGTSILPLLVSPCRYSESALGHLQALNSTGKTLAEMTVSERERVFLSLAEQIASRHV